MYLQEIRRKRITFYLKLDEIEREYQEYFKIERSNRNDATWRLADCLTLDRQTGKIKFTRGVILPRVITERILRAYHDAFLSWRPKN